MAPPEKPAAEMPMPSRDSSDTSGATRTIDRIIDAFPASARDQIRAQLERLVPVHKVSDLTEMGPHVERELALIKVVGDGQQRNEALRIADIGVDNTVVRAPFAGIIIAQ